VEPAYFSEHGAGSAPKLAKLLEAVEMDDKDKTMMEFELLVAKIMSKGTERTHVKWKHKTGMAVAKLSTKSQLRPKQYGAMQKLYSKDRGRAANAAISGSWAKDVIMPEADAMLAFWSGIFASEAGEDNRPWPRPNTIFIALSAPVDGAEVTRVLKMIKNTAPGPDKVTVCELHSLKK
jgi:hypothetical protein